MSEEKKQPHHGKQNNQKMKPYLVLQYLLRDSDENNVRTSGDIEAELLERGITASAVLSTETLRK